MFRSAPGIDRKILIAMTVVIQMHAMVHITYYRWRYQRQDNQVHVFHLTSSNQAGSNHHLSNNCNQEHQVDTTSRLNTQTHNKIMFEIRNMILLVITCIIHYISDYTIRNLSKSDYSSIHPTIYYLAEFFTGILFNVMFPCYFYITNEDARTYFKKICFKT